MSFSADGNKLAWVGHDSSISVADATRDMATHKLKTQFLPLLSCVWIGPNSIVAAGHGCVPMLFKVDGSGQVAFVSKLEEDKKAESNSKFSARAMFQSRDKLGVSDVADTILNTTHQNQVSRIQFSKVNKCQYRYLLQISCIQIQNGDKANANKISTSAGDGKMVVWDLRSLEKSMTGLKI